MLHAERSFWSSAVLHAMVQEIKKNDCGQWRGEVVAVGDGVLGTADRGRRRCRARPPGSASPALTAGKYLWTEGCMYHTRQDSSLQRWIENEWIHHQGGFLVTTPPICSDACTVFNTTVTAGKNSALVASRPLYVGVLYCEISRNFHRDLMWPVRVLWEGEGKRKYGVAFPIFG